MNRRLAAAGLALAALTAAGCGVNAAGDAGDENQDPHNGRVTVVQNSIYKFCDGRNLIYTRKGGGISVISQSPECTGASETTSQKIRSNQPRREV